MSRVALIGENSIEYVDALIDIWNHGDCAVLLDWRIPFRTAANMMAEASVSKCYIEQTFYNKIDIAAYSRIEFIPFERKSNSAEYLPKTIYDKFQENYSRNEAIVIYSSGTTGKAKGVILSHFAINTNADAIIDYMCPTGDDCIYIAKSFTHASTLTGELLVALKTRMKLVVAPTIVPLRYILRNIENFTVSIVCLNPTLLSMFVDEVQQSHYNISSLRCVYVSGSILNDKIYINAHKILGNIPIYNVYGLSEAGPRVTAQRIDCCKGNSVGKPIAGVEVLIVDEKGKHQERNRYGIVHIKTPSLFETYITGKEKNKAMCEGYFNTGDVGYIDGSGELHILNRVDDVIIINSHKIYPTEVEAIVLSHPKVIDCIVFCTNTNNLVCKYITNSRMNIEDEVSKLCRLNLANFEIPSKFIRVKKICRNSNGKIVRQSLN